MDYPSQSLTTGLLYIWSDAEPCLPQSSGLSLNGTVVSDTFGIIFDSGSPFVSPLIICLLSELSGHTADTSSYSD